MLQPLRLPLALGLTLVLAACASTNPHSIGSLPDTRHTDLDKTLTIAGKKKGEEAVSLYLSAADLAWQQGDSLKARTLVDSLDLDSARPAQQIFANTLLAEMALARKQPEMALQLLQAPVFERLPELPASQQARSQEVKARALEATGQLLSAVRERIFIAGLLVDGAAHSNLESTWSLVSRLQPPVDSQAHENELNGWLALSDLVRSNSSLAQKQQGLQEWISNNPKHPAALQLPAEPPALQEVRRVVQIFRELRSGYTEDGKGLRIKSPSGTLSPAEAISVINSGLALAGHFGDGVLRAQDVASGLLGAVVKDPVQDSVVWQEYLETVVKERSDWKDLYRACREQL